MKVVVKKFFAKYSIQYSLYPKKANGLVFNLLMQFTILSKQKTIL